LQRADERKCGDVLTAIRELGQLALEIADIRFEAIVLPHLDWENLVVVSLSLLARCVLGDEHFRHLLEVAERMQRQGVVLV